MAMTISEKILANASGEKNVKAGDIIWVDIDCAMLDDILEPRVEIADHIKRMGVGVWDPDKVVIVSDHYTPPANIKQANIVKYSREWAHIGVSSEWMRIYHSILSYRKVYAPHSSHCDRPSILL